MKTTVLLTLLTLAHDFYSDACCANRDCRPVPCEEITSTTGGWFWGPVFFAYGLMQVAPDGRCHVCTSHVPPVAPHCIYLPPRTT